MQYTVVDIETTGLSEYKHKITEIAAVRIEGGKMVDSFQTLINPGVRIPSFITRLTGITDEMVRDAPPIHEVMPAFVKFLGNTIFVAHNASFDYRFLNYYAQQCCRTALGNKRLCTRKLANRLLPELGNKRLSNLCEHFNITNIQAHRALADVHATVAVLNRFLTQLQTCNIQTVEDMLRFEQMPKQQCMQLLLKNN